MNRRISMKKTGSPNIEKKGIDRINMETNFETIEMDNQKSSNVLNLTLKPPRTPYERSVFGIVGGARMADKARAFNSNILGEYRYGLDSGLDTAILDFLGITAADFMKAAIDNINDIELSESLEQRIKKDDSAKFSFNAKRALLGRYGKEREMFLARRSEVGCDGSEVNTFFDLMDYDDQKSFLLVDLRRRAPRSVYDTSAWGVAGLARLIDKGIANKFDMLGKYKFGNRSYLDDLVLEFLELSESEFIDACDVSRTGVEIENWLRENCLNNVQEDEIVSFNEIFWSSEPTDLDEREFIRKMAEAIDPQRKNIYCFAASAELEDKMHFARMKVVI